MHEDWQSQICTILTDIMPLHCQSWLDAYSGKVIKSDFGYNINLPKRRWLSITFMVISYVFPIEYFSAGSSELIFDMRVESSEWKDLEKSFWISKQPPVELKILRDGQQPTGGTLIIPNFLAPRLYKDCTNKISVSTLKKKLLWLCGKSSKY